MFQKGLIVFQKGLKVLRLPVVSSRQMATRDPPLRGFDVLPPASDAVGDGINMTIMDQIMDDEEREQAAVIRPPSRQSSAGGSAAGTARDRKRRHGAEPTACGEQGCQSSGIVQCVAKLSPQGCKSIPSHTKTALFCFQHVQQHLSISISGAGDHSSAARASASSPVVSRPPLEFSVPGLGTQTTVRRTPITSVSSSSTPQAAADSAAVPTDTLYDCDLEAEMPTSGGGSAPSRSPNNSDPTLRVTASAPRLSGTSAATTVGTATAAVEENNDLQVVSTATVEEKTAAELSGMLVPLLQISCMCMHCTQQRHVNIMAAQRAFMDQLSSKTAVDILDFLAEKGHHGHMRKYLANAIVTYEFVICQKIKLCIL